jgi:hypothetical protein
MNFNAKMSLLATLSENKKNRDDVLMEIEGFDLHHL